MFVGLGIVGTVVSMLGAEEAICIWPSAVFWFLELACNVRALGREAAACYCCHLLFETCTQLWSRAPGRCHHSGLVLTLDIKEENEIR